MDAAFFLGDGSFTLLLFQASRSRQPQVMSTSQVDYYSNFKLDKISINEPHRITVIFNSSIGSIESTGKLMVINTKFNTVHCNKKVACYNLNIDHGYIYSTMQMVPCERIANIFSHSSVFLYAKKFSNIYADKDINFYVSQGIEQVHLSNINCKSLKLDDGVFKSVKISGSDIKQLITLEKSQLILSHSNIGDTVVE